MNEDLSEGQEAFVVYGTLMRVPCVIDGVSEDGARVNVRYRNGGRGFVSRDMIEPRNATQEDAQ